VNTGEPWARYTLLIPDGDEITTTAGTMDEAIGRALLEAPPGAPDATGRGLPLMPPAPVPPHWPITTQHPATM